MSLNQLTNIKVPNTIELKIHSAQVDRKMFVEIGKGYTNYVAQTDNLGKLSAAPFGGYIINNLQSLIAEEVANTPIPGSTVLSFNTTQVSGAAITVIDPQTFRINTPGKYYVGFKANVEQNDTLYSFEYLKNGGAILLNQLSKDVVTLGNYTLNMSGIYDFIINDLISIRMNPSIPTSHTGIYLHIIAL